MPKKKSPKNYHKKQTAKQERLLLTVKEAAYILNISPGTIYQRLLPNSPQPFPVEPVRIGRSVRFKKSDIMAMVNGEK